MKLRPFDYLAVLLSLGVIAGVAVFVYSGSTQPGSVRIESPEGRWIYPLDRDTPIPVPGPIGTTEVIIENRLVRVVDSPCPEKLCIRMGAISTPGAWIACLPNRVFVHIVGRDERGIDATAF